MQCINCGKPLPTQVPEACPSCGIPVVMRDEVQRGGDAAVRMLVPIGRSGWAIAAGYAGIFCLAVFPGPVALILGLVALWDFKKRPERLGRGRAWFGVIAGGLATGLLVFVIAVALLDK